MAKSAGNFVTIRELLQDWPGEVLRFNMLRTHYRQPIDWTISGLEQSASILGAWFPFTDIISEEDRLAAQPVIDALSDDMNTPQAIAEMHALHSTDNHAALSFAAGFLGFTGESLKGNRNKEAIEKENLAEKVEPLVLARTAARARKDFAESDRIRDELAAMGIVLKDSKDGTIWEIAR
jgi:cysteinyl-tRNA synthetase